MKKLLSLIAAGFAFSLSLSPLAQAADSPAKLPSKAKWPGATRTPKAKNVTSARPS
ncbi:hypothetical protein [Polaromonas sp. UBA4122]|uniref:hypothetical protein n=1 Tax=Polaromonas sp. UBA4122 TaxID=1947074 RepID=UPI0025CBFF0E|nr:hypothetical protein [Polaromonas sp. UBA4122]